MRQTLFSRLVLGIVSLVMTVTAAQAGPVVMPKVNTMSYYKPALTPKISTPYCYKPILDTKINLVPYRESILKPRTDLLSGELSTTRSSLREQLFGGDSVLNPMLTNTNKGVDWESILSKPSTTASEDQVPPTTEAEPSTDSATEQEDAPTSAHDADLQLQQATEKLDSYLRAPEQVARFRAALKTTLKTR